MKERLTALFDPEQRIPNGKGWTLAGTRGCLVAGIPDTEYHGRFSGLSSSILKYGTAAEMQYALVETAVEKYGNEQSARKWTLGSLLHWAVLEPWKFDRFDEYAIESPTAGLATKQAQEYRRAFPDKLVVTAELVQYAIQCRRAVQSHPRAQQLLTADGVEKELSAFHWDAEFEFWRKARFDIGTRYRDYIGDVKTTAMPLSHFPREVRKRGYHIQAAWYLDTWEAITGKRMDYFYWIAVTKRPPFMCQVFYVRNVPRGHAAEKEYPLYAARNMIDARQATFLTSARETLSAYADNPELSAASIRHYWPAYENEPEWLISSDFELVQQ